MSNHHQHISPPNLEVSALKTRVDGYDKLLRDFAANIIRLLEMQLHQTHMIAGRRNLECPICVREAELAKSIDVSATDLAKAREVNVGG